MHAAGWVLMDDFRAHTHVSSRADGCAGSQYTCVMITAIIVWHTLALSIICVPPSQSGSLPFGRPAPLPAHDQRLLVRLRAQVCI